MVNLTYIMQSFPQQIYSYVPKDFAKYCRFTHVYPKSCNINLLIYTQRVCNNKFIHMSRRFCNSRFTHMNPKNLQQQISSYGTPKSLQRKIYSYVPEEFATEDLLIYSISEEFATVDLLICTRRVCNSRFAHTVCTPRMALNNFPHIQAAGSLPFLLCVQEPQIDDVGSPWARLEPSDK